MSEKGGTGEVPDKPTRHLDKAKNTGYDKKHFNPYRLDKSSTDENNIRSQNSDAETSKTDTFGPKRWTKQLVDLFDRVGNLTSADTQKLKESIEAGDRINETKLQNTHTQEQTTKTRQCEGVYRLFMDSII